MKIKRLFDYILDLLFVPRCVSCDMRLDAGTDIPLCAKCYAKYLEEKNALCPTCGQQIYDCWCGISDDKDGIIDREAHAVAYFKDRESIGKRLILFCKKVYDTKVFDFAAGELSALIYKVGIGEDCIITYVPRSKHNKRRFGHDQSAQLAARAAKQTGLEMCDFFIHRGSKQQKTLTFAMRRENARSSFSYDRDKREIVKGKHVFLIDDLVTSGASVVRCATLLKRCRADSVTVISLGKTAR